MASHTRVIATVMSKDVQIFKGNDWYCSL